MFYKKNASEMANFKRLKENFARNAEIATPRGDWSLIVVLVAAGGFIGYKTYRKRK